MLAGDYAQKNEVEKWVGLHYSALRPHLDEVPPPAQQLTTRRIPKIKIPQVE
jgi:hypothetical protein